MRVQAGKVFRPANIDLRPAERKGLVLGGGLVERIGLGAFRVEPVDHPGQIRQDELAELVRIAVILSHRHTAQADALLQIGQFLPALAGAPARLIRTVLLQLIQRGPFMTDGALLVRKTFQVAGIPQVKKGVFGHGGIPQHPVQDLQLGHGGVLVFCQPGFALDQFRGNLVRHPAVALPQQADEIGPAALDLAQADRQHLAFGFLLIRDAPAQVHLAPGHPALLAQFAELREDVLDQQFAFGLHVAEGGRDEDAQLAGLRGGRRVLAGHAPIMAQFGRVVRHKVRRCHV